MTMDDQDRELTSPGETTTPQLDPIESVLDRLESKSNQTVYEAIVEIKNLIIGNNKYKSIYLKEKLVRRLLALINDYYLNHLISIINQHPHHHPKTLPLLIDSQLIDIINQILTILSSFALGNLDHCSQLINSFQIHDMLFNLIRLARIYYTELIAKDDDISGNDECLNSNFKLIEASLRCLANLYNSAQMAPSLIAALDSHLYAYDVGTKQAVNLDSFIKLFQSVRASKSRPVLHKTSISSIRSYILTIFSISTANCMYLSRDELMSGEVRNWRALVIKSDLMRLFAGLLTNLNPRIQLACLKFYHAVSFECVEAARIIMTTSYYDVALLDLISAYLSRENSAELQLYAAKCVTNLYRSSITHQQQQQQSSDPVLDQVLGVLTSQHVLIKHKTLPALIRLASTYSAIYRGHISSSSTSGSSYFFTNHLLSCVLANSTRPSGGYSQPGDSITATRTKLVKLFGSLVLVDSLATLGYLIETSADLQYTAAYLEQIIPSLISNVSSGFNSLRFAGTNGVPLPPTGSSIKNTPRSRTVRHFLEKIDESKEFSRGNLAEMTSRHHSPPRTLYSLTYLYYSHFSSSATHGKLNEHQYNFIGSIVDPTSRLHSNPLFMRTARFLSSIDTDLLHSRIVAVSLQTLAVLALNNEESRRVIGGDGGSSGLISGSDLIGRLIELIEADGASLFSNDDVDHYDLVNDMNHDEDEDMMAVDKKDADESNNSPKHLLADATLLKLSALSLLHSLSRSVHQLRTKFLDIKLTNSVSYLIRRVKMQKDALNEQINKRGLQMAGFNEPTTDAEMTDERGPKTDDYNRIDFSMNEQTFISLLLAILANMLIDFSPCKETLINNDIIKTLIEFVDFKNNISIRVNSMWALMNLAYQSEQSVKQKILSEITIEKLFQLLTEQDETLVLKTLGLIRNLICYRSHIDAMMANYGNKIVQAIVMILEGEYYNYALKEQALCILANIADGSSSKTFIMENEDLLRKINSFMTHSQTELQVAAVYCVLNLVNMNDDGALERQIKLREIGAQKILQKLLHSSDPVLFDKVKNALQQFPVNHGGSTVPVHG